MLKNVFKLAAGLLMVSLISSCGLIQKSGFITGSGVYKLGEIGGVEYYSVHADHFVGPNQTAMVTLDTNKADAKPDNIAINGGDGIGKAFIGAAGNVASAYLFGHSLEPDEYSDSSEITVEGGDQSNAQGQGQLQGQLQGQGQESYNKNTSNSNSNSNSNSKADASATAKNKNKNANNNINSNKNANSNNNINSNKNANSSKNANSNKNSNSNKNVNENKSKGGKDFIPPGHQNDD